MSRVNLPVSSLWAVSLHLQSYGHLLHYNTACQNDTLGIMCLWLALEEYLKYIFYNENNTNV